MRPHPVPSAADREPWGLRRPARRTSLERMRTEMARYWYVEMAFGTEHESIDRSVGTDSPEALVQLNYAAEAREVRKSGESRYGEHGTERAYPKNYRVSYAREITEEEADTWEKREVAEVGGDVEP